MNEKEQQILKMIKDNPFISQNELSEKLNLSRPSVANYISSLIRKGEIVGRAYILREKGSVICIGGANVDRKLFSKGKLQPHTSNPVTSFKTLGGVARNIAENLGRLGVQTSLLTAIGEDSDGEWIIENSKPWMNLNTTIKFSDANTGNYSVLLDQDREMIIAFAEMDICNLVTPAQIEARWNFIASASYCILDLNFPKETVQYIIDRCNQDKIPLIITPVSVPKVKKLPDNLQGVHLIIANREEIEAIAKAPFKGEGQGAVPRIFERGVENLIVTIGSGGAYYFSKVGKSGHLPAHQVQVKDITGAGDSLSAGVVYGLLKGFDLEKACHAGQVCAAITIQSEETVSTELSPENIESYLANLI